MTGTPLPGYIPYFQAEVTPGTAANAAMVRVDGIRTVRPARGGSAEPFKGGGGKATTSVILSDDFTNWSLTPAPCFRALGLVMASRIATPVTTTPGGATTARQHVFTLNPNAPDTTNFYTLIWADATNAFQSTFTAFQSFGLNAQRSSVECSSAALGRIYDTSVSAPSSGVTDMLSRPMQPNKGDIWVDANWGALGTTKMLAAYQYNLQLGDKFDMDAPINSAIVSYQQLVEKEDQSMTLDLQLAVDAAGRAQLARYDVGSPIAVRYKIVGPIIEAAIPFSLQIDQLAYITSVGEVTSAPNSSISVFPFTCELAKSGSNILAVTLVNDVTSYAAS